MDGLWRKRRYADGEIFRSFRCTVSHPFSWMTGDGLSRPYFQYPIFVFNLDPSCQDNLGFGKLRLLPLLGPSRWADDSSDTHRGILCCEPARKFLNEFRLGSDRRDDAGLCDQSGHRTISFQAMLKKPSSCILDALPSSHAFQYAPGGQPPAAFPLA